MLRRRFEEALIVNTSKCLRMRYTYEVPMVPVPDKEDWSVPDNVLDKIVLPSRYKRIPRRPRK
ncbi:hypothetical protein H5410_036067 [Solanum commersonii]|uniref:Uncharacterized protein n=1 Tax=Solanum commersonii TaxID=4109 RepID=A0A9J5Y2H5_SOLCO|nr:hypothetical protein H5410_036067 [Solanum commersonii]